MLGFKSARGRAIIAGVVLVILLAGVATVAVWRAYDDQQRNHALERTSAVATALEHVQGQFWEAQAELSALILLDDPSLVDNYHDTVALLEQNLSQARTQALAEGEADQLLALDNLTERIGQFNDTANLALPVVLKADTETRVRLVAASMSEMVSEAEAIIADLEALVDEEQQELAATRAAADRAADTTLWLLVGFSVAAFVVAIGTIAMLIVSVVRPLAALRASATAITSGDLEARAKVSGPEEVASLARDFNEMTDTLAAKTQEYIDTTNLTGVTVMRVDKDNRISLVNDAMCEFLGKSREEILGTPIVDYLHPEDAPSTIRAVLNMVQSKGLVTGIMSRYVTPRGTRIVEWNGYPIFDEEGRYAGVHGTGRDISERKRIEEALRTKDFAIEASINGIALADLEGNITYVNPSLLKMWGYDDDSEMVGKHVIEFWQAEEKAREAGRALRNRGSWIGELVAVRRDGSTFDVQLSATSVTDAAGKPICIMGSFVDITKRKLAEEALRESEGRYRLLAENATDVIWTMDTNLRFTYVSPSITRMTGYTVEEAKARTLEECLTPTSLKVVMKAVADEWAIEETEDKDLSRLRALELEEIRKDGSTIWTELRMTSLRDKDNRLVGILGVSRDITERKRAEGEIHRRNEEISEHLRLKTALNECSSQLLKTSDIETMSEVTLDNCRSITASPIGFVGYIDRTTGYLVCPTMTREVWSQCSIPDKSIVFEKLGGIVGWPLEHMEAVISNCPPKDPRSRGSPQGHIPTKRFLGVPCQYEGKLVGMIGLANRATDYDQTHVDTVNQFATLYALAIKRHYSEQDLIQANDEVRRRNQELDIFLNLSKTVASTIEFDETIQKALDGVTRVLPQASAITLATYDKDKDILEMKAVRGLDPEAALKMALKPGEGMNGKSFKLGKTVFYSSAKEMRTALANLSPRNAQLSRAAMREMGPFHSAICSPLIAEERALGSLLVITSVTDARFGPADVAMLEAAASHIAVALNKARLHADTKLKAITDSLTGLYNHAYFYQRLAEDIERSKRYNHGFAVVMMDVDAFKHYNDSRGHQGGDEALRLVGDCIRSAIRRSDLAFRYGGDEFAAILLRADSSRARAVVNRMNRRIAARLKENDDPAAAWLGISAGVACFPEDATTADELVRMADAALYNAKRLVWARGVTEQGQAIESSAFPRGLVHETQSRMLSTAAGSLAVVLEDLGASELVPELDLRTVAAVAAAAEIKDPYIRDHQQRVSQWAAALADEMGLPPEPVHDIRVAGLLHDLGKVSISEHILNKPGKLTEEEYAKIKEHAPLGAMIVAHVEGLQRLVKIVRHHHERFDGKGYPDGLAGEDIPLEARILAVADVFDAMTHERSYRKALSREEAIAELERGAGTQFDPAAVKASLALLKKRGDELACPVHAASKAKPLATAKAAGRGKR